MCSDFMQRWPPVRYQELSFASMQIFLDPTSSDKHIISVNCDMGNGNANCHFCARALYDFDDIENEFPHQQKLRDA